MLDVLLRGYCLETPTGFRGPTLGELEGARVFVCTCTSAFLLVTMANHQLGQLGMSKRVATKLLPTHILVDEAAQALLPETLIPLTLATPSSSIVLAGDPNQLGPTVHSIEAARGGLRQSLLERWIASVGIKGHGVQLKANYRSHAEILELPSRMFYRSSIVPRAHEREVQLPSGWDELDSAGNGRDARMLFYGVRGQQMREGESPSWFNPVEAEAVVELLVALLEKTGLSASDVGVMATFRKQVQTIRLLLRARGLGAVRVGTVDDYQGQQERCIFLSTVITRPKTLHSVESELGFLNNPRRFNVAVSRAKALNVVCGHPLTLMENPLWGEFIKHCVARDAFRGAGSEHVPSALAVREHVRLRGCEVVDERVDDGGIAAAVHRMAELSLLGAGDSDQLASEELGADSLYDVYGEAPSWRVQL